ncbi:MAG: hypothetical protein M3P16_07890 [Chloroflexota bacterium]|nr:hypothetical protein [Chloroflexota bacterium]
MYCPPERGREWALGQRGWNTIEGTSDPDRVGSNRLARDALLTEHVRRTAARGLTTIDIEGSRSLADVTAEVERRFAPLLG